MQDLDPTLYLNFEHPPEM